MSDKMERDSVPVINSPRIMNSSQRFAGKNELRIAHVGVEYILRITKANKLILTK